MRKLGLCGCGRRGERRGIPSKFIVWHSQSNGGGEALKVKGKKNPTG